MKKRFWMVIPFAAALALCLGLAVGCGEQESAEHVHEWGEYTVTVAPTCEKTGEHVRTCTICGAEDPVKLMPALGHSWDEGKITTPATCETDGEKIYTCKNDPSHTKPEKIDKLGHKWKVKEITKQPTCTEKGEQEMVCENDASHTKTMDISPAGHKWGEWIWDKQGDCVTDGKRHRECTVCHTPEEEDVPAQGHKYGTLTDTKPATCTERGVRSSVCSVCGQSVDQAIAPLGHQWEENPKITKQPTCEEKGSETYTCSVCHETKDVDIPATGHKWDINVEVEPTATTEGKQTATCETCGDTQTSTIPFEKGIYRVVVKKLDGRVVRTKKYWDIPDTGKYVGTLVSFYNKEGVLVFEKHVDFYDLVKEEGMLDTNVEHTPFVEVELPIQDYTVKLSNIPDGYYYKDSYELKKDSFKKIVPDLTGKETVSDDEAVTKETKATEPVDMDGKAIENGKERTLAASLDITLVSHASDARMKSYKISNDEGSCGDIREGAVLPDCSWVTTDNQSIVLSDLLKEKKIVILDLYFFTCPNCKDVAPYFVEFANAFKDDIAVICLDMLDTSDSVCNSIRTKWNYPDWFYIVKDYQTKFYMNIEHGNGDSRPGAPRQVVIDQGFAVAALHGNLLERTGQALMECLPGYFGKDYQTELAARQAANEAQDAGTDTTVMPVMLPERKELFA